MKSRLVHLFTGSGLFLVVVLACAGLTFALENGDGEAKNGVLSRKNSPAFTLAYPKDYKMQPTYDKDEIFRGADPAGLPSLIVAVRDKNEKATEVETRKAHEKGYVTVFKILGSDVKTLSNKKISNYGKHPAYELVIQWKFQGTLPLTTVAHIIVKEDKDIHLNGIVSTGQDLKPILEIYKTLNLDPTF